MNVKKIREDFPLLLANPDLTYLDSAATSQKPACVLRAEREFYECHNANPLRGLYELSENATKCYEDATSSSVILPSLEHSTNFNCAPARFAACCQGSRLL